MTDLFGSYQLGKLVLKNRAAMAPMTRARAPQNVPAPEMARYYAQRSGVGLIVTEGTVVSASASGTVDCPGIWSEEQVAAWQPVTAAAHDQGAAIFTQLWHVGRVSHELVQPNGAQPVSASAKQAQGAMAYVRHPDGTHGFVPASVPHALTIDEIAGVVEDFAIAAENAIKAGFDGVEIHGANGYLVEQFINATVNDRDDIYGGSIENRIRFALEIVDACVARIGADRVGIRLTPFGRVSGMAGYEGEGETYLVLARALSSRGLAYVHLMDQNVGGTWTLPEGYLAQFRAAWNGPLILAGGLDLEKANALLEAGLIDIAAFGVPLIGNPDLIARLRNGWPLATPDRATFYGSGYEGYTDYPTYTPVSA
ncbi:alkene reductase [Ketogulonicigenium vulgare]|uniref:NADH:flavin oxidoreductase / NADH oxidase family protein n=1 Tax=Ketogulonicigenium vulgare (strain WSH-001) TaxID=759362 RepID=F9Y651_KETVW|nr:alkene reductase [Ketogulonicigenium vulgare]ADO43785.1 morphinone reductase [Ketogulonicigenium vulgare Y25]AEM42048.1 NADH:flavin oxidoreductase / NADH oxidase family protein [Ketogulonicigenium vulgare WSH-001]ALJ82143.1 alkene reductase [Ketogulonicigenium vulgare]ANW34765.1 alkene reductase [Ketogulonicigenium vulgare]AOZ55818.1 morphinone reductase [Ketogulonicigenium vulgare]